jgi:hypothetical protein
VRRRRAIRPPFQCRRIIALLFDDLPRNSLIGNIRTRNCIIFRAEKGQFCKAHPGAKGRIFGMDDEVEACQDATAKGAKRSVGLIVTAELHHLRPRATQLIDYQRAHKKTGHFR